MHPSSGFIRASHNAAGVSDERPALPARQFNRAGRIFAAAIRINRHRRRWHSVLSDLYTARRLRWPPVNSLMGQRPFHERCSSSCPVAPLFRPCPIIITAAMVSHRCGLVRNEGERETENRHGYSKFVGRAGPYRLLSCNLNILPVKTVSWIGSNLPARPTRFRGAFPSEKSLSHLSKRDTPAEESNGRTFDSEVPRRTGFAKVTAREKRSHLFPNSPAELSAQRLSWNFYESKWVRSWGLAERRAAICGARFRGWM